MRTRYDAKLQDLRDEIEWGPNVEHPTIMWIAQRVADLFVDCPRNCLASPNPGLLKVWNEELWEPCQCGGTGIMPSDEWWSYPAALHAQDLARYLFGGGGC